MQVIENWADLRGTLRSVDDSGSAPGFATALMDVESVAPVPGFANLFEQAAGHTIAVNIPRAAVRTLSLSPGRRVTCRVRKGGPQTAFAHPEGVSAETV